MTDRQHLCFGYRRVSTERQAREGISLDEQEAQIRATYDYELKATHAWGGMFTDDVSGKVPLRSRPQGADLFARLEKGDAVIFAKMDRAFRSLFDMLETVKILKERGVRMIFRDLRADTATASGQLMLHILGAFAEFEHARISERVREGLARLKAQGVWLGSNPPYGFKVKRDPKSGRKVLVPCPEERAVASKIVEWKDKGWSFEQIAVHLMYQKVLTKKGTEYGRQTVFEHYRKEKRARKVEAEAAAKLEDPKNGNG